MKIHRRIPPCRNVPRVLRRAASAALVIAVVLAIPGIVAANTGDATTQATRSTKRLASSSGTGRQKNLNFDGDYVETMGKSPLDSLTSLNESQKGRDAHLYRKRAEFAPETAETLKQSRFEQ